MSKQRKSKLATLRMDADWLARQMEAVSTMMWTVAERMAMEEFDGFNPKLKNSAMIMAKHAALLSIWADEVLSQAKRKGDGDEQV